MKSLRIIFLLIALGVSGSTFAQVLVKDGNNQTHASSREALGTVKGAGGSRSDVFFVSGSLGAGVTYGGYGAKLSVGYNWIGLSLSTGKTEGTLLSYSFLFPEDPDDDTLRLNKDNTAGTGFMIGVDLWLIPSVFYYNFSYLSMGKIGDTPVSGGLFGMGGHINIWNGIYMDLGAHLGLLFPGIEGMSFGMSAGGSIGVGYKF